MNSRVELDYGQVEGLVVDTLLNMRDKQSVLLHVVDKIVMSG